MVMQLACASLLATSTFVATSTQAGTLEDVQARAAFGCVVRTSGEWHGFNFCSATAPAVFGDPKAIKAGTSMRVGPKAGTEFNLADYFHANDMKYEAVTIETNDTIGIDPEYHAILPEIIPKESPATHQIEGRSCEDPVVLDEKILKAPSRPPSVKATRVRSSAREPTGPTTSSSRSALTAISSSATSEKVRADPMARSFSTAPVQINHGTHFRPRARRSSEGSSEGLYPEQRRHPKGETASGLGERSE